MNTITKSVYLNDELVEFPRLTLTELHTVADKIKADREKSARELGIEMKMGDIDIYNVVLEIRTSQISIADVYATAKGTRGAETVVRRSMSKAGFDKARQDELLSKLGIHELLDLAEMLVVDMQQKESPKKPETGGTEGTNPLPVSPGPAGPVDSAAATAVEQLKEKLEAKAVGFGSATVAQ